MRATGMAAAALALAAPAAAADDGMGRWRMVERLPGVEGNPCMARAAGDELNMSVMLNNEARPVLILARPDWDGLRGEADASLSIDGGPAQSVEVAMVVNLVLPPILDEAMITRLSAARTLDWTLPMGRFRAEATGFAAALAAIRACNAGKARGA